MYCRNCGNELKDNDNFCNVCGQAVSTINQQETIENNNSINIDISQFGNNRIAACKYVSKTYGLSLTEAKKIVDEKYNELNKNIKELKNKFVCTNRIGNLEIDGQNKLFRIIGAKKNAFAEKNKHGFFSNTMALGTFGMTRILENATNALANSAPNVIYNFDDIISFELLEDNNVITSGGLGSAALATFLTGSYQAGAIGAIVGSKKQKKEINMMSIKLNMNNLNNSCVIIPLIDKKIKSNSNEYKTAYNKAQQILSALNAMKNM